MAKHTFISAEDADFLPCFKKVCRFATIHLFEFARDFAGYECPFDDDLDKLVQVIDNEDDENSLQADILDKVYGNDSKLDYEPWKKNFCDDKKGCPWFFTSSKLRK